MGNCTGVFGACVGEDPTAVRKIDKEKMQLALAANNNDGSLMLQDGGMGLKNGDNYGGYPGTLSGSNTAGIAG
jgi:hypothetical protein